MPARRLCVLRESTPRQWRPSLPVWTMVDKRRLPQVDAEPQGLGLPTIMDRALAAEHGVSYVHLAVFCIDLDRMHQDHLADERMVLGWEVFLTECFVCGHIDPAQPDTAEMLHEMCAVIMEAEVMPVIVTTSEAGLVPLARIDPPLWIVSVCPLAEIAELGSNTVQVAVPSGSALPHSTPSPNVLRSATSGGSGLDFAQD